MPNILEGNEYDATVALSRSARPRIAGIVGLVLVVAGLSVPGVVGRAAAEAAPADWVQVSSPNPKSAGEGDGLSGVACPSASRCFAVGSRGSQALVIGLVAGKWRVEPGTVAGGNASLDSVSCISVAFCLAVGNSDSGFTGLRYDGKRWSAARPARVRSDLASLNGVACPSRGTCWAVGQNSAKRFGYAPLLEQYRSGHWRIERLSVAGGGVLSSVACSAVSSCWAVGASWRTGTGTTQQPLVEHWNGHVWRAMSAPGVGKTSGLFGVSCKSRTSCFAAGNAAHPPNSLAGAPFIDHYDGRSWTSAAHPKHFGEGANMTGIWCGRVRRCVAVGAKIADASGDSAGYIVEQGTSGWQDVSAAEPRLADQPTLTGVACASARECYAVGSYDLGASAVGATLILRGS